MCNWIMITLLMTVFVREILFDQQRMHFICLNNLHKGNKSIFEI